MSEKELEFPNWDGVFQSFTPTGETGAWVVTLTDYHEEIECVFKNEIDALRYINEKEFRRVRFVEFGKTLIEMDEQEENKDK